MIPIPPCPDPERYQWITTHEGSYWRLKRGLGKPAKLNTRLSAQAAALAFTSKAASRIIQALKPAMSGIRTGRINIRFSSLLRKQLMNEGRADFSFFKNQEFQPAYPLESLLPVTPEIIREKKKLGIRIQSAGMHERFKGKNGLVNGFDCKAILLSFDPHSELSPAVTHTQSEVILSSAHEIHCELWLPFPKKKIPWMLILKISGYEHNAPAIHARHYAMKVLDIGN